MLLSRKTGEITCNHKTQYDIIKLSERYEQAQLKPTKITIREF